MTDAWSLSLWPTKAQFRPGDIIGLVVRVSGPAGGGACLSASITEGGVTLGAPLVAQEVAVPATGDSAVLRFQWQPPQSDSPRQPNEPEALGGPPCSDRQWRAFGLDACLVDPEGEVLAQASTAFDVTHHWSVAPRYGFLADFGPHLTPADDAQRLEAMLRLHLNVVQFYDWMYTHHTYLPPEEIFTDPLGRTVDFGAVRRRIELCRQLGMAPIAYGSVYGGEWDLMEGHPDWLLYDGTGQPMLLAGTPFHIQDVSPECGWRAHLMGEYQQALDLGFAGLHCDTYGSPRRGLDSQGREVRLDRVLPDVVAEAQDLTVAADPAEGGAIFNCVGGWPLEAIALHPGSGAALYVEVWDPHWSFRDLYEVVLRARRLDSRRQVILAAYIRAWHPKEGAGREGATPAERAEALAAMRLAAAAIFASGGFHLLPGEGTGVLAEAYYPTHGRLTEPEWEQLRAYWDFQTRYGPWLADPTATDVSFTHVGGSNRELRVTGAPSSPEGLPGTVWVLHREGESYRTINLINLTGVTEARWTGPQPEPVPVRNLEVRLEVLRTPRRVWAASPDRDGGRHRPVAFELIREPYVGLVCVLSVPELHTWELLVVEED